MAAEGFPIISRRLERMKRMQTLQHVLAAFLLATAAKAHLERGHAIVLPSLEILAALLLVGAAVRDQLRRARGHGHDRVGWVEIAGGVMTLVEAVARTRERHHLSFLILSFVQPAVLFAFGILDMRIAGAHYLEAGDDHFVVRLRLLFRRSVAWNDVRAFRFAGETLNVQIASGERTLSMRSVANLDEAREWTREQFRKRGIEELR